LNQNFTASICSLTKDVDSGPRRILQQCTYCVFDRFESITHVHIYLSRLGDGHKGFADIWPVDRSAHVVGVSREHVTHNNALIDIPAGKKTATFETGLDMLISEIFGNYECEHRRSGTRESSILEMDSDVYYQLKQRGEKETNDILDLVAKLIDQMLVCKQGALQNGMNWKSIGMTPPSYTTNGPQQVTSLPDIVDSIDWRIVMHCAEHVGVPEK
jgi:hypothetical protein